MIKNEIEFIDFDGGPFLQIGDKLNGKEIISFTTTNNWNQITTIIINTR